MSTDTDTAFDNWAHDRLTGSDVEHAIYEDDRPLLIDTTEVLALMREAFEAGYRAAAVIVEHEDRPEPFFDAHDLAAIAMHEDEEGSPS